MARRYTPLLMSENPPSAERLRPSEAFAKRQKEARLAAGITQEGLSKLLGEMGYGLSRHAVNEIENGKRRVSLDDALAIAAALSVAPVNLIVPFEDPEPIDDETAHEGIFRPLALLKVGDIEIVPLVARAWIRGVEALPEASLDERYRFHVEEIAPPARFRLEQVAADENKKWWKLAEEQPSRFWSHLPSGERGGLEVRGLWVLAERKRLRARRRTQNLYDDKEGT